MEDILKINWGKGVASVAINNTDSLFYGSGIVPKKKRKRIKTKEYVFKL